MPNDEEYFPGKIIQTQSSDIEIVEPDPIEQIISTNPADIKDKLNEVISRINLMNRVYIVKRR